MEEVLTKHMRLLVVSQYFWPENFRINELVEAFTKRGHEVTVLTGWPNYPGGSIDPSFRLSPSTFNEYHGARIVRVPMFVRGQNRWSLALNYISFAISSTVLGIWKLRGREFDVIFTNQLSPVFVGFPGAMLRWIKRAPMAFWILDLWPASLQAVGAIRSKWILNFMGSIVKWIYKRCDLILLQSERFKLNVEKYVPKQARMAYFPAWTDDVFVSQESTVAAEEIPLRPDLFTVMFAGNIGHAQDLPAILQAAEYLRDQTHIRWVIVGDGRMVEWARQQIEHRRLSEQVTLAGRFPLERMPSFFAHASAMLVSLTDEEIFAMTIPGKVQAYLGAGLPILAMLNGEGARIIEEANAGLTSPASNSKLLAANVLKMSSMTKDERDVLGQNARRYAKREFDKDTQIAKLEGLLFDLIQRNRRVNH